MSAEQDSEDEASSGEGPDPPDPEVTSTLTQVRQEKHAAMIREQNTVVTNIELAATLVLLVMASPFVLPAVVVGHCRTKRAIRRAKTEVDNVR